MPEYPAQHFRTVRRRWTTLTLSILSASTLTLCGKDPSSPRVNGEVPESIVGVWTCIDSLGTCEPTWPPNPLVGRKSRVDTLSSNRASFEDRLRYRFWRRVTFNGQYGTPEHELDKVSGTFSDSLITLLLTGPMYMTTDGCDGVATYEFYARSFTDTWVVSELATQRWWGECLDPFEPTDTATLCWYFKCVMVPLPAQEE